MNHAPTFCRVWAPATVANLNVGFDALGCALKAPGEFMEFRRVSQPGVHLVNGPNTELPLEVEANVAGKAAASLLHALGNPFGVEVTEAALDLVRLRLWRRWWASMHWPKQACVATSCCPSPWMGKRWPVGRVIRTMWRPP